MSFPVTSGPGRQLRYIQFYDKVPWSKGKEIIKVTTWGPKHNNLPRLVALISNKNGLGRGQWSRCFGKSRWFSFTRHLEKSELLNGSMASSTRKIIWQTQHDLESRSVTRVTLRPRWNIKSIQTSFGEECISWPMHFHILDIDITCRLWVGG